MDFNALADRVRSLTVKERIGISLAIAVVIYAIWDFTFMQPMLEKESSLNSRLDEKNQQIMTLNEQVQNLIDSDQTSEHKKKRQRLDAVIKQLELTDQRLLEITSSLIGPEQMAEVLKSMLAHSSGLKIQRLQGLGAKPFPEKETVPEQDMTHSAAEETATGDISMNIPTAWRHGLRLEFSGSYLETLEYLKALENLEWKFYWDNIELEVDKYPNVNTAIEVYTLSLDKGWIDV